MVRADYRSAGYNSPRYAFSHYPGTAGKIHAIPLVRYSVERPAGCTGLLRLFGMQVLWHAILEHGYMRVVKNAVEEGSESFGYMLCLAASLAITLPFALTQERNSLFPLRRQRRRGKYLSTPSLGRYGGHVRKTYPKRGNQASISANSLSLLPSASILRLSTKGGWNV